MSAKPPNKLRVLLVDDSELVRVGLRSVLEGTDDIEVVAEAASVATAITTAAQCQPDVVLLDLRLPDGMGFDACRRILRNQPNSRILVLTSMDDAKLVDEAIRAGAHGYLLKEINAKTLINSILEVAAGKSVLDPTVTARVLQLVKANSTGPESTLDQLSPQEKRVLALIAEGHTNKEVAQELGLAEKTVKNYLSTVFEKLHVTRRSQAAVLYSQLKSRL
ncbi:MAG: response regulator transcription factor [Opitutaceae bacterium]|nr:response regulator transcription factor [Cephaloticoccus sp.]MCP5531291.1 response regulator transcription factor [Opitutaceae bacterium]